VFCHDGEFGPKGIRVNAVAPGFTATEMVLQMPEKIREEMAARVPLRRMGEPRDIGNAYLFLASDEASYISGEVLGANIAFSAAIETATNSDDFGNKIALETDSAHVKVAKLLTYYAKGTIAPSSYVKYKAVTRPGETKRAEMILGELLGGRAVFHDTPVLAERVLRRIANTQKEAVALRRVIEQGRYVDPADVGPQLDKFQAALNKNQLRLRQALGTLRSLGMSEDEIYRVAKSDSVKLSADTIRDATNGTRRSWTFAPDWARKLIANKAKTKEQEAGPVLDAVVEWIRKNPSFYPVVPEDDE
jgi:hypothetical protein